MKKTILSLLFALMATTGAWAEGDAPEVKPFTVPSTWQNSGDAYTADDLPSDFVACSDDEAAAWAASCTEGSAVLIYSINNVYIKAPKGSAKSSYNKGELFGTQNAGSKIYYTVASAATTVTVTEVAENQWQFTMPAYDVEVNTELWYKVDEEKTVAENIAAYGTKSDFFLNRTLTAGVWNTFASPFAIAAGDMEKYFGAGAKVRQLNTTSVDGTVLTLNFTNAASIEAGQPYLVKPAANVDFSADGKEFAGVDLSTATATPTPTTYVNFVPTLGKTAVDGDVKDILILNGSGTLVHPSATGDMKGFRGYFLMHEAAAGARAFIMNFGEGETTGIQPIRMENGTTPAEGTYDLSGRRIQGQPTQKGVYIQNGKKVIIK